jgi:uncharacterized hydrophobic protein (TIGR00341 family)
MSLRIIEISAPDEASDKIHSLAEEYKAIDYWYNAKNKDGRRTTSILMDVVNQQELLDALQRYVSDEKEWRIALIPVEATLPKPEPKEDEKTQADIDKLSSRKARKFFQSGITREELYASIEKGAIPGFDFIFLVILSTIVAAVGLIHNDPAVVIGAMVIAPLLGPNLAMAFGAVLGDKALITRALKANIYGVALTLLISVGIGLLFSSAEQIKESAELLNRTNVTYAGLVLALAAGSAAVLSLTTGVSSALVGVMVAVALMPPAVTFGVTLGTGAMELAYGAFLLLGANIVCINIAAQGVFILKGIRPRTWYEERQARKSARMNAAIWISLLMVICGLIALKQWLNGDLFSL